MGNSTQGYGMDGDSGRDVSLRPTWNQFITSPLILIPGTFIIANFIPSQSGHFYF